MTEASGLLSPPHQQGSGGEKKEHSLLKGTTTPRLHAKQLWCILGVVVLLALLVWLVKSRWFWMGVKARTGMNWNMGTL